MPNDAQANYGRAGDFVKLKLLFFFFAAALLLPAADPAFVNCAAKDSGGSSASTVSTAAKSLTTGSTVYVVASRQSNCSTFTATITDDPGNTYTRQGAYHDDSAFALCTAYFKSENVTGNASNHFTLTWSSPNTWISISVMQISLGTLDTTARGDTASTPATSVTTGNWTTAQANEFEVTGMAAYAFGRTWTADTGWTLDSTCTGVDAVTHMQYRANQAVHTTSTTPTISGAATYIHAGLAAFKGAGSESRRHRAITY